MEGIENIDYKDGVLYHKNDPELKMTLKEIAALLGDTGGPITGKAHINPGGQEGSYAANIVDVKVDPETGKFTMEKAPLYHIVDEKEENESTG